MSEAGNMPVSANIFQLDRCLPLLIKTLTTLMTLKKRKTVANLATVFSWSGYQDSNLGPSAPKADALTGLRYTPNRFATAKVDKKIIIPNFLMFFIGNISPYSCRNFAAEDVKKSSFYLVIKNFLHIFVEHNLLNLLL